MLRDCCFCLLNVDFFCACRIVLYIRLHTDSSTRLCSASSLVDGGGGHEFVVIRIGIVLVLLGLRFLLLRLHIVVRVGQDDCIQSTVAILVVVTFLEVLAHVGNLQHKVESKYGEVGAQLIMIVRFRVSKSLVAL